MLLVIPKFGLSFAWMGRDDEPTRGGSMPRPPARTYRVPGGLGDILSRDDGELTEEARELAQLNRELRCLETDLGGTLNRSLLSRTEIRRLFGAEGHEYYQVSGFTVAEPTLANWFLDLRLDLTGAANAAQAELKWRIEQLAEAPRLAARTLFGLLRPLLRVLDQAVTVGNAVARLIDQLIDLPPPPLLTAGGKAATFIPLC